MTHLRARLAARALLLLPFATGSCSADRSDPQHGSGGASFGGSASSGASTTGGSASGGASSGGSTSGGALNSGGNLATGGSAGHAVGGGGTAAGSTQGGAPTAGGSHDGGASEGLGGASFGGSQSGGADNSGGSAGAHAGVAGGGYAGRAAGGIGGSSGAGGAAGAAGSGNQGGAGGMRALAATPPMGWNSWNTFQCNINEALIKATADAMVSSGMKAAGYEYLNLDDCWMNGRDASGALRWNTTKFPSGIPALAEYVHGKGLKFGIYQAANSATCVGIYGGVDRAVAVGSLGHEQQDAATFASWGVDMLKYDLCAGQRTSLVQMGAALRAGSRPILYSINPGNGQSDLDPPKPNWDMQGVAHIWRIGFDIDASWGAVIRLTDENANLHSYAGPGHFNDPDMLEVGKLANVNEDRAHFALWAIMAAPLIAGNDLRSMSAGTREILTNQEIIAVDQDSLGIQGRLVASPGANLQVWSKTLSGTNARAVALFNRGTASASISVQWAALGLPAGSATVRDLWTRTDVGTFDGSYTATNIPAHGAAVLRITSAP